MRIVMMGTGPFAVPTFRALLDSDHDVSLLITRPVPPPTGRRRKQTAVNPMREVAEAAQLEIHSPESVNTPDVIEQLRRAQADLFVVCDFGQILSADALSAARLGGINLHASLLPKYRGAAPINWAIYEGETTTGVTVIHMTKQLDAGPSLTQITTPIGPHENAQHLEQRLAKLGVQAVMDSIDRLDQWDGVTSMGIVQDDALSSKAPRLKKSDGQIRWNRSAAQIERQIRAFYPWPGAFTDWHREKGPLRLRVEDARVGATSDPSRPPGSVVVVEQDAVAIACGEGQLWLEALQPAGKKSMPIHDFLRGYPIQVGETFG